MKYARSDSDVGFTAGIIAGAVVGAGLGLLLAPASGVNVRGGISDSVRRARTSFAKNLRALADRAEEGLEYGISTGTQALIETTHVAQAASDTARRDLRAVTPPAVTASTFHE